MESTLMMAPPCFTARSSASADLPLAVGPAIRSAFFTRPGLTPAGSPMLPTAMPLVATLISAPNRRTLAAPLADMASRAVGARAIDWLAEDIACDLILPEGTDATSSEAALRTALAGVPVDIAVQESAARRKKLL